MSSRKILVTSALPYANGPIHLGHLVEYIQTDVWARFQRMRGHQCYYICAEDAHGTPIMLKARQEGISAEELIERVGRGHRADFAAFNIAFDNYYTTHSDENRFFAEQIYQRLDAGGHIARRQVRQAFDPVANMFLPDRFIRGECPRCGAPDQYGDSCEVCGATYTPTELKNPVSVLSGETPEERESEHYFVKLADFEDMLRTWIGGHDDQARRPVQAEIANKLEEWFQTGLQDWDISRDAPYFGFEIPDAPGKFFYVWLDAPIGYMASFKNFCDQHEDLDFDAFWLPDSDAELYHFIGKDIAYFHTLFWPAQLHGAGYRRPTAVFCHGFLTVNGQKMSKSRGTFIKASTYLAHLDPEYLRYYFACKLGSGIDDLDLNLDDFMQRVNADLVGKVVNIASRCAGFINKTFAGRLSTALVEPDLYQIFVDARRVVETHFEGREYGKAVREIMRLADLANQYIDERKPWRMIKNPDTVHQVQDVCTMGLNLFRVLMIYLKPILPVTTRKAEAFLGGPELTWESANQPMTDVCINAFEPLMVRIDANRVQALTEASKEDLTEPAPVSGDPDRDPDVEPIAPTIVLDEFARIDLRVARVKAAEHVDGADRLLRMSLDLGAEQRVVFAGVKTAYRPEDLVGRMVVVVANLAHRKMRFGTSEGMVLAAGPGGEDIWLLGPDEGARPGMRIK